MSTRRELEGRTRVELLDLARQHGLTGYSRLSKEQLVHELAKALRRQQRKRRKRSRAKTEVASAGSRTGTSKRRARASTNGGSAAGGTISPLALHDLAYMSSAAGGLTEDEAVLQLLDANWFRVCWRISRSSVEKARAALAHDWYRAEPVIRLIDLASEEAEGTREVVVREEKIDSLTTHWFFHVPARERIFRVDIGYVTPEGRFILLLRTNTVRTPRLSTTLQRGDEASADLRSRPTTQVAEGPGQMAPLERRILIEARRRSGTMPLWLHVDAEVVIRGATHPDARVEIQGEPVEVSEEGTFFLRFPLPEGRQVIPVGAISPDGYEERTVVLALERNTRELSPAPLEETIA